MSLVQKQILPNYHTTTPYINISTCDLGLHSMTLAAQIDETL